jgi:uncharacterized protein (DUF1697 family)
VSTAQRQVVLLRGVSNAVVTSEHAPAALADVVRSALAEHEGLDVAVVVRTPGELRQVVDGNPLLPLMDDPARMLVSQATKALLDPRRGLGGTARNWRTGTRLAELAATAGT